MPFPLSDHFNGKSFHNPGGAGPRGWRDLLRWKLGNRAVRWPAWVELPKVPATAGSGQRAVTATWINHATFLLETPQGNFLTDPFYSKRASPFSWIGPRRVHAPGVAFDALPRIDGVLLSHDHYDHCDLPTLQRLCSSHRPRFLAPLGHGALLTAAGIGPVTELDWWETHAWSPALAITLTPARHWCRRKPGETNVRLWGGFFLASPTHRIFFAGDSAYDEHLFAEVGQRLGAPDLAMIPIGGYEPRWFMREVHMNPTEAVRVHRDTGSRLSVGMHWGTLPLTDEGRDDPPQALAAARTEAGLAESEFRVLSPGESVAIPGSR